MHRPRPKGGRLFARRLGWRGRAPSDTSVRLRSAPPAGDNLEAALYGPTSGYEHQAGISRTITALTMPENMANISAWQ